MSLSGISHNPFIGNIAQSISLEGAKAWGADVLAKIAAVASEVFNTLSAWFAQGSAGAAAFYAANQAWLIPLGVAVGVVTVIGVGLAISKRYAAAKAPETPAKPDETPVDNVEGAGVANPETPENNGEGSSIANPETPANNGEGSSVTTPETPSATTPKENEKEEEVSVALNEMATVTPKDFVEQNRHVLALIERVGNSVEFVQGRIQNIETRLETLLSYYQPNVSHIEETDEGNSTQSNSLILDKLGRIEEAANRVEEVITTVKGLTNSARQVNVSMPDSGLSPIKEERSIPTIGEDEFLNSEIADLVHTNGQQQAV
ncbi:MAG: hypothetical protein Q8L98_08495 [Chlamydiales bacterium]|nr:hypothetical protein [Chlamydiales bacterium]